MGSDTAREEAAGDLDVDAVEQNDGGDQQLATGDARERGDGRRAGEHPGDGLRRTVEVGGLDVAQMGAQEGHGDKHEQDGQDPVQGARDHLGGQVAPRCAPTRLLVIRLTTIIQCGASAAAGTATSRAGRAVATTDRVSAV